MELVGMTLTITLKNTSADGAGSGAGILLTGIGFSLPGNYYINSGSANMGSSTAVGFTKPGDGNVSQEWGFDTKGLDSGALQGTQQLVNNAVSSMESQTTSQFLPGSIAAPTNLNGPDFGLISMYETGGLGDGVEAILDSIIITLNLGKTGNGNGLTVGAIDSGWVALTFGSPGSTSVPDAGASVVLLGLALLGLGGLRRKLRA